MTDPEVALCIDLSGTHVVFRNPFVGVWLFDRVDWEDRMFDQAHELIEGVVAPAARMSARSARSSRWDCRRRVRTRSGPARAAGRVPVRRSEPVSIPMDQAFKHFFGCLAQFRKPVADRDVSGMC